MKTITLRITENLFDRLKTQVFRRYPSQEWATFIECAWHHDPEHGLAINVIGIREPREGDLDASVDHVEFTEPYSLRMALTLEGHPFGAGVVHSHPEEYRVFPSLVDDDMDSYFSQFFDDFAKGRPYTSLIFALDENGVFTFSGRVWFENRWLKVDKLLVIGETISSYAAQNVKPRTLPRLLKARLERFTSELGEEAAERLWNSTVTIAGCGGTGSPAGHSLARSGVGRIILIDNDYLAIHNSERIHGAWAEYLELGSPPPKVLLLAELIRRINPDIEVIPIFGNLLQAEIRGLILQSSVILGCTDTEHGMVAVSELAYRYLVPAFQVNVALESKEKTLTGEILQFTRYLPGFACAFCRAQVDSWRLTAELMSEDERKRRKLDAQAAEKRGEKGDAYWRDTPIIPTIGALTTIGGELAANFAIGAITGRFKPAADFFEMNLLAPDLGVVSAPQKPLPRCACATIVGHSEQGASRAIISVPLHWSKPRVL
ncbi:MAG: ThiF family adenylyltransferase [Deltaproteobacteria bacterium]|nr:ThiF family adenylyltransferase [Deltaproteobacteria bacterium]